MKILLMGDASNFHNSLATGLRKLGHEVAVCSQGGAWMRTHSDITLPARKPGKLSGLIYWLKIKKLLSSCLQGFDIVSISNPNFLPIRPSLIRRAFDFLKSHNRSIFLTALGTDPFFVQDCLSPDGPLCYSEFRIADRPGPHAIAHPEVIKQWISPQMLSHCSYIYDHINGAVADLYEYFLSLKLHLPPEKYAYAGIPIDTDSIPLSPAWKAGERVKIFLGRHSYRQDIKGTDLLFQAASEVQRRHPEKCTLVLVEDKPYDEYLNLLTDSDLVLDQVYSYTPATNALLAMAMGKTVLSGAEPEFYDFIQESDRPLLNASLFLDELTQQIENVVLNPSILIENHQKARDFVVKHNNSTLVAQRFLSFWQQHLP